MDERMDPDQRQPMWRFSDPDSDAYPHTDAGSNAHTDSGSDSDAHTYPDSDWRPGIQRL